jgi:hypothetical protein
VIARAAIVVALVLLGADAPAGTAQTTGATISGVVVTTEGQPQPIPRAVVTITGGNIPNNLSAITDETGRFQFANLAPGRYNASVSKPAYLPMAYGATRPGRPGTSISITGSQAVDLRIALPRGAVITGQVRDQFGEPVQGVQINVSRADAVRPVDPTRLAGDTLTTDDRGVYRAYGLMPDEYVVSASMGLRALSLLGGDMHQLTRAEIDARLRQLDLQAGKTAVADPQPDTPQPLSYAATFYPGTSILANAVRIRVAAGEERSGVDIPLVPVRAARVSGTILASDVQPQFIRPTLIPAASPQALMVNPSLSGPAADGAFTFTNVTPGRYTLLLRTGSSTVPYTYATADIVVDGADISGIVLALRPSLSISGRVVFDATTLKPPENMEILRVTLVSVTAGQPAATYVAPMANASASAPVRNDGTFRLQGVIPGSYTLQQIAFSGWWLRSAVVNGRDILDFPLEVDGSSTDVTGAVVTMTDRRSELHGTLTSASGQPATEFAVVVFPSDRAYWRPGARRVKSVRPGSDGAFSVPDLPAGDYLVAAVTDADPNEWQQASFLEQLAPASVRVTIADGQKTRQDLRIAR